MQHQNNHTDQRNPHAGSHQRGPPPPHIGASAEDHPDACRAEGSRTEECNRGPHQQCPSQPAEQTAESMTISRQHHRRERGRQPGDHRQTHQHRGAEQGKGGEHGRDFGILGVHPLDTNRRQLQERLSHEHRCRQASETANEWHPTADRPHVHPGRHRQQDQRAHRQRPTESQHSPSCQDHDHTGGQADQVLPTDDNRNIPIAAPGGQYPTAPAEETRSRHQCRHQQAPPCHFPQRRDGDGHQRRDHGRSRDHIGTNPGCCRTHIPKAAIHPGPPVHPMLNRERGRSDCKCPDRPDDCNRGEIVGAVDAKAEHCEAVGCKAVDDRCNDQAG